MKFSGVTRSLLRNVWVGSTPAQPLQVTPGLYPGLFPEIYLLFGFWHYQVRLIWNAFDKASKIVEWILI